MDYSLCVFYYIWGIKKEVIMKKNVAVVILSLMFLNSFSQGKFSFSEESYDFGTVIEGVQAKHTFKFTNTGDAPIVISGVRASCGCTTPSWPKEPITPGETGEITAIYNSKGRVGVFNKSIRITSNATEPSKTLFIKGNVINEPPRVYTEAEKANSPKITIDRKEYNFGKVEKGEKINKTIEVKNTGKTPLKISEVKTSCNCVAILKNPEAIAPGKQAELVLIYSPKGVNERVDKVSIISNDIINPQIDVTFKANLVESITDGSIFQSDSPF